ncbi:MAG: anaerobic sulfatase maturase [Defluviitaleaceae bacterium]|nr:anaerobic sulfatase maturase [Defluviitaleaceae bacterium]
MKHINLLIKPASGLCNMRCIYCFYHSLIAKSENISQVMMSAEVADILVKRAFEEAEESCTFAFQGGEPTLVGLNFFEQFVKLVNRYNTNKIAVQFAIQTNGLSIDESWADFFKANNFLVGISIDGLQKIHDSMRKDSNGLPTYTKVINAYRLLAEKKVDTNILCVVNGKTARMGLQIYKEFKNLNCRHMQFIPCLDSSCESRGNEAYSLLPERYAYFLKSIFDQWYNDWKRGNYHSIRLFDDYVFVASGVSPSACATSGQCGQYALVEANGSVYPCDFYVTDDLKLGNIIDSSFEELLNSEKAINFIEESKKKPKECLECKWFKLCRGGCKRDWYSLQNSGGIKANYYCDAFKDFFDYAYEKIIKIAKAERNARNFHYR